MLGQPEDMQVETWHWCSLLPEGPLLWLTKLLLLGMGGNAPKVLAQNNHGSQ